MILSLDQCVCANICVCSDQLCEGDLGTLTVPALRLTSPASHQWGQFHRIICVYGEVTEPVAAIVVAQLLQLESVNPDKPIQMYINSPGGSVTDGLVCSPFS